MQSISTQSRSQILILALCYLYAVSVFAEEAPEYEEIEWVQLMPEDDLVAILNPPNSLMNIPEGAPNDGIDNIIGMAGNNPETQRYFEALKSRNIVSKYENKRIKLPGFIVPLANDEDNNVTEFFIVPYFGACLHYPPPPPNQIIYAKVEQGFELESLHDPFYFKGKLLIEQQVNALGISAYRLIVDDLSPYE